MGKALVEDGEIKLHHLFGIDTTIKENILPIKDNIDGESSSEELLYLAGKYVVKHNIRTNDKRYALNTGSCDKFGCMTTNNSGYIYFGEVGINASILICNVANLQVLGALKGGSNVGYACLDVSHDSKKLCSITLKPEHVIIVWDLEKMAVLMKTKTYAQDVYHVAFSPYNNNVITTSGKGHLKCWKMADTFTGSKLQGSFGKFGKIEVSDIQHFIYIDSSQILAASDSGYIMLWVDGFLICVFGKRGCHNTGLVDDENASSPMHKGGIHHLYLDRETQQIISLGADGCINWSKCDEFVFPKEKDEYEVPIVNIQLIKSLSLKKNGISSISNLVPFNKTEFIISGTNGKVCHLNPLDGSIEVILDLHGGIVTSVDVSQKENLCVTCGDDGSIHLCDYFHRTKISSRRFSSNCSYVTWCTQEVDATQRSFVVGFSDGRIDLLHAVQDRLFILASCRPFKTKVNALIFKGQFLAVGDDTGSIFIFKCSITNKCFSNALTPIGFVECENGISTSIKWQDKNSLQYADSYGNMWELEFNDSIFIDPEERRKLCKTNKIQAMDVVKRKINCRDTHMLKNETSCKQKCSRDDKFLVSICPSGILSIFQRVENESLSEDVKEEIPTSCLPQFKCTSSSGAQNVGIIDTSMSMELLSFLDEHESKNQYHKDIEYSLEELLVKELEEKKYAAALEKRKNVKKTISTMRTELLGIKQLNHSISANVRLPSHELSVNNAFESMYEEVLDEEKRKAAAEHKVETEKVKNHLQRMEEIFVRNMENGFFIVSALKGGFKVQSLPLLKLDEKFIELKKSHGRREIIEAQNDSIDINLNINVCVECMNKSSNGEKIEELSSSLVEGESRKDMRLKRKAEMEKLLNDFKKESMSLSKVDDCGVHEHVVGDWKLKSAKSYRVPSGKHINLQTKLEDMINCEELIFQIKKSFNLKLLSLQKKKEQLLVEINSKDSRRKDIESIFNGTLPLHDNVQGEFVENIATKKFATILPRIHKAMSTSIISESNYLSNVEADEIKERKTLLKFESNQLVHEIQNIVTSFDKALYETIEERVQVLLDTKQCEMKLLNMLSELRLLQKYENGSNDFQSQLDKMCSNEIEIKKSTETQKGTLELKKQEFEKILDEEHKLFIQFDTVVPKADPHREDLYKIFTRKKKVYHDDDISDDDGFDSEESFYESDDEIENCPEGCPEDVYDKVLELQQQRCQHESEKKFFLRKLDSAKRYYRQLCSHLEQAESDKNDLKKQIQSFEDEKQKELNSITEITPLKNSQIYAWEDDMDMTPSIEIASKDYVVVKDDDLMAFIQRSHDAADKIVSEEEVMKKLKVDIKSMSRDNTKLVESINEQRMKCENLQVLKFGQKIDIDRLDELSQTQNGPRGKTLYSPLEKAAKDYESQIDKIETTNRMLKGELKNITDESTRILNEIAELSKRQLDIEKHCRHNANQNCNGLKQKEKAFDSEISNLKILVRNQVRERESLQRDINQLKRKDGKSTHEIEYIYQYTSIVSHKQRQFKKVMFMNAV